MGVEFDFSDVASFLDKGMMEVGSKMAEIGERAVQYARETGTYKDSNIDHVHLRESNYYRAERDGLVIGNSKEYASMVESRGYKVVSHAALRAESELKKEFGR